MCCIPFASLSDKQLTEGNRQFTDSLAAGVIDGVRNRDIGYAVPSGFAISLWPLTCANVANLLLSQALNGFYSSVTLDRET